MTVEATQQYRLKDPGLKQVPGQSAPPDGFAYTEDGARYEMAWGDVFQASSQTTNLEDYSPGRVHVSILQTLADNRQLEAI